MRDFIFAGNQTRQYFSSSLTDSHQRALTCTTDGTYMMKTVLHWSGDDIEESVCVRYGEGSENAECPELSYVATAPAAPAAPAGAITVDVLDSYPLNERITLTAANAGDTPRWLVTRTPIYNSRVGLSGAKLVSCTHFSSTNPLEKEMQVNHYAAICKVTLQHSDDRSNEITRCINFGDVTVTSNQASYVNSQCGTDY